MKTQVISVVLLSIVCVALLVFSASTWNEKVRNAGAENEDTPVRKAAAVPTISAEDIRKLGASLDEGTLGVILSRAEAGEHVQMLIVGSEAILDAGERFASVVDDKYEGLLEVDVATFDTTSTDFVDHELTSGAIDWEKGYDIVLYEPFTLQNNGVVVIEKEQSDLLEVKALAESYVEDVSFLVTPPQPIYKARFYLAQIAALEKFTGGRDIPYINHWVNWPDTGSEELQTYLDEAGFPTEKGIAAWSDALLAYFTGG